MKTEYDQHGNCDTPWRRYWYTLRWCISGGLVLSALFILLVDPFDGLSLSLPMPRAPVAENQRYAYPALARKSGFDSIIFGTSATRPWETERLNRVFDASFVNLSIHGATPYEQLLIGSLFLRHHPNPKMFIVAVDAITTVWCQMGTRRAYDELETPEWLFDENSWNDLPHLFNSKTFGLALDQIGYALGLVEPEYGLDGYRDYTPQLERRSRATIIRALYDADAPQPRPAPPKLPELSRAAVDALEFLALDYLEALLAAVPKQTTAIVVLNPLHHFHRPVDNTVKGMQIDACKTQIASIAAHYDAQVVDFMIDSGLTTDDDNFYDGIHITVTAARDLIDALPRALSSPTSANDIYRRPGQ